jgi:hypothetical protein
MRLAGEAKQVERIRRDLSGNVFVIPWLADAPTGVPALLKLAVRNREVPGGDGRTAHRCGVLMLMGCVTSGPREVAPAAVRLANPQRPYLH